MSQRLSTIVEDRLAADPASPAVTYYDLATGERIELSGATLANWVAKTCGLLVDGHGVAPGERIGVWLPVHWQSIAILFACWRVGGEVVLDHEPTRVAFVQEPILDAGLVLAEEVIGLSLGPMAGRLSYIPLGAEDYAIEVPAHPDRWTGPRPDLSQAALADRGVIWNADDLLAQAVTAPAAGERIASMASTWDASTVVNHLLAPLATGGSVVLIRNSRSSTFDTDLVASERITHLT